MESSMYRLEECFKFRVVEVRNELWYWDLAGIV